VPETLQKFVTKRTYICLKNGTDEEGYVCNRYLA
jgi:hypothetical protein